MLELKSTSTQLELFQPSEITRPDVNIAKWAGWLFSSPWAKNLYDSKAFTWTTKLDDEEVQASINIRPINGRKRPTTTTYRVFLALIQLWEILGKPTDGVVMFSARQLAHTLGMKWCGSSTANSLHEQIDILANTSISWTFSFKNGNQIQNKYTDMHILEGQTYFEKSDFLKKQIFTRQQQVVLNRDLVANMLAGSTKPVNYKTFISIKNDSSANLYTLLDVYLSKKNSWQRCALALLTEDLEFTGKRYLQKRIRHAKLKEFVAELDGKELSTGRLSLSIRPTADKSDYKLVASKKPRTALADRRPPRLANPKDMIPMVVEDLLEGLAHLHPVPAGTAPVLEHAARWYPRQLLLDVLAEVKADYRNNIKKSPIKTFMYRLHVRIHQRGLDWMNQKTCGPNCRYRPENMTTDFYALQQAGTQRPPVQQAPVIDVLPVKSSDKARKAKEKQQKDNLCAKADALSEACLAHNKKAIAAHREQMSAQEITKIVTRAATHRNIPSAGPIKTALELVAVNEHILQTKPELTIDVVTFAIQQKVPAAIVDYLRQQKST